MHLWTNVYFLDSCDDGLCSWLYDYEQGALLELWFLRIRNQWTWYEWQCHQRAWKVYLAENRHPESRGFMSIPAPLAPVVENSQLIGNGRFDKRPCFLFSFSRSTQYSTQYGQLTAWFNSDSLFLWTTIEKDKAAFKYIYTTMRMYVPAYTNTNQVVDMRMSSSDPSHEGTW